MVKAVRFKVFRLIHHKLALFSEMDPMAQLTNELHFGWKMTVFFFFLNHKKWRYNDVS